jgi:hypothetical protein
MVGGQVKPVDKQAIIGQYCYDPDPSTERTKRQEAAFQRKLNNCKKPFEKAYDLAEASIRAVKGDEATTPEEIDKKIEAFRGAKAFSKNDPIFRGMTRGQWKFMAGVQKHELPKPPEPPKTEEPASEPTEEESAPSSELPPFRGTDDCGKNGECLEVFAALGEACKQHADPVACRKEHIESSPHYSSPKEFYGPKDKDGVQKPKNKVYRKANDEFDAGIDWDKYQKMREAQEKRTWGGQPLEPKPEEKPTEKPKAAGSGKVPIGNHIEGEFGVGGAFGEDSYASNLMDQQSTKPGPLAVKGDIYLYPVQIVRSLSGASCRSDAAKEAEQKCESKGKKGSEERAACEAEVSAKAKEKCDAQGGKTGIAGSPVDVRLRIFGYRWNMMKPISYADGTSDSVAPSQQVRFGAGVVGFLPYNFRLSGDLYYGYSWGKAQKGVEGLTNYGGHEVGVEAGVHYMLNRHFGIGVRAGCGKRFTVGQQGSPSPASGVNTGNDLSGYQCDVTGGIVVGG